MPLKKVPKNASKATKNKIKSDNFHELRHGKTFAKTAKKEGKVAAEKQMIAIELKNEGRAKRRKSSGKGKR